MAFPQDLPYTRHSPGRGQFHPQGTGPLQFGQNQDCSRTRSPAARQKLEAHFAEDRLPGLAQCDPGQGSPSLRVRLDWNLEEEMASWRRRGSRGAQGAWGRREAIPEGSARLTFGMEAGHGES